VLMGVPPLDLEVTRRALMFKIKKGLPLSTNDWVDQTVLGLSVKERQKLLQDCVRDKWQARWNVSFNGRVTFEFIKDVSFVSVHPNFKFNLYLGFLLTGHGSLNAFLHKRGLSESASCYCGAQLEDWIHVLCECPLYSDVRVHSWLGIKQANGVWEVGECLLTETTVDAMKEFANVVFKRRRLLSV